MVLVWIGYFKWLFGVGWGINYLVQLWYYQCYYYCDVQCYQVNFIEYIGVDWQGLQWVGDVFWYCGKGCYIVVQQESGGLGQKLYFQNKVYQMLWYQCGNYCQFQSVD